MSQMTDNPYFGVYRVLGNGTLRYLDRSATCNEKLANEIARERSLGEITMPDGRVRKVRAYPHIVSLININIELNDCAESRKGGSNLA